MEAEFDKEIDALLRKSAAVRDAPVDAAARHLSADEIAAFAANAVPTPARMAYIDHLSNCERCRVMLSSVITLSADSEPVADRPVDVTPAAAAEPWYRGFLRFPNLAYTLGALILMFAGFLTFSVVRNSAPGESQISQIDKNAGAETARPAAVPEPSTAESVANTNQASNASVATVHNSEVARAASNASVVAAGTTGSADAPKPAPRTETERREQGFTVDGARAASVPVSPERASEPAPPPPAAMSAADTSVNEKDMQVTARKVEDLPGAKEKKRADTLLISPGTDRQSGNATARRRTGPTNAQAQTQLNSGAASNEFGDRRVVSGKSFERKQGVWYDVAFGGQRTVNVRRGTAEYKKLDGGLRSIADGLGGTVVVVWKGTAYRIN